MMKEKLTSWIRRSCFPPFSLLYRLLWPAAFLGWVYKIAREQRQGAVTTKKYLSRLFPDLRVRHGPFKGMQYLSQVSTGGDLFPRLIGSYESELAPVMERILARDYTAIVDVGCGEGYYAVGLARHFPKAQVYAFDINPEARRLCQKMADLNGVAGCLHIGEFCDAAKLAAIPYGGPSLIVSDCEGYERELFSGEAIPIMAQHDMLIEIHDLAIPEIANTLRRRFEATHDLTVIDSIDGWKKVRTSDYPELRDLAPEERIHILGELRQRMMEWFYFTPKKPA